MPAGRSRLPWQGIRAGGRDEALRDPIVDVLEAVEPGALEDAGVEQRARSGPRCQLTPTNAVEGPARRSPVCSELSQRGSRLGTTSHPSARPR